MNSKYLIQFEIEDFLDNSRKIRHPVNGIFLIFFSNVKFIQLYHESISYHRKRRLHILISTCYFKTISISVYSIFKVKIISEEL